MKLIIRLLSLVVFVVGFYSVSNFASAQALRTTVFTENHLPGGFGLRVDLDYDIANLAISDSVVLQPTIGMSVGYNASIDDPRVRHLIVAGGHFGLRTVLSADAKSSSTSIDAIPWAGFAINACLTIENSRAQPNTNTITTAFDSPGIATALCYGPVAGIDVLIGGKLLVSFGVEALFFSIGDSGWNSIPIAIFGLRTGIGYNAQF